MVACWGVVEAMVIFLYTHLKTFYFSAENSSSLEADNHFKPSPRPRSMLKKRSLREEKAGLGEDKEAALHEELAARSAPLPLARLNGGHLGAEKQAFSENPDPEVSTTAELLQCVLKFRLLHLILRERKKINICVNACVHAFYLFSQTLDKKIRLSFFNILYSIQSKTPFVR